MIGMGDEYTPEESQRQDAVEALGSGIRLGAREAEEENSTQLESADLQRLEAVQNMHNLHSFVGIADNGNSLIKL